MGTKNILLSIAIPTYNRSQSLDLCLASVFDQLSELQGEIEIVVSDNNSIDDTEKVINKYMAADKPIRRVKNSTNIGAEKNVIQCFNAAIGKYVLILGDDDILLSGSLAYLVAALKKGDYGVVALSSQSYKTNFKRQKNNYKLVVYDEVITFLNRVNYTLTFVSGNIVNKTLVEESNMAAICNSNLPQVAWALSAIFNAKKNAYIEGKVVAGKTNDALNYPLCQVFGININKIFDVFISKGVDKNYFRIINNHLLYDFLPHWILKTRKDATKCVQEDRFKVLYPVFRGYLLFWLCVCPIIFLPIPLAQIWLWGLKGIKVLYKTLIKLRGR